MCGAMIGLFAGYLLKTDPTQGLGLSALALLAGYNVSGVFSFMDEFSDRISGRLPSQARRLTIRPTPFTSSAIDCGSVSEDNGVQGVLRHFGSLDEVCLHRLVGPSAPSHIRRGQGRRWCEERSDPGTLF